jgi:hypothetical protein
MLGQFKFGYVVLGQIRLGWILLVQVRLGYFNVGEDNTV